jgi:hypothetical protein
MPITVADLECKKCKKKGRDPFMNGQVVAGGPRALR